MPRNISAEIETLRQKLAKLESRQLSELRAKRREAQKVVDDLDARIAKITGKSPTVGRRKRTSPPEVRERIFKALEKNPKGLSQKEISNEVGLPYGSVVLFLKRNEKEFKTTGERKQKRYLLK